MWCCIVGSIKVSRVWCFLWLWGQLAQSLDRCSRADGSLEIILFVSISGDQVKHFSFLYYFFRRICSNSDLDNGGLKDLLSNLDKILLAFGMTIWLSFGVFWALAKVDTFIECTSLYQYFPEETADLVIFTKKILNGKLHFLFSAKLEHKKCFKILQWVLSIAKCPENYSVCP